MDSYYNTVLCSGYPAAPGSYLGTRIRSKTNREKKKTQQKTQKSRKRFLSLLKQLLLKETSGFWSLVGYVKDYYFPKEWLASILFENKAVSDAGDSWRWQLPDTGTAGAGRCRSELVGQALTGAFPSGLCTHVERHKRKELSHRNPLSLAVFIWFLYLAMF